MLKEKLNWTGELEAFKKCIQKERALIESGQAEKSTYYFHVGSTVFYAVEVYVAFGAENSKAAFQMVVDAALEYFFGDWRTTQITPDGKTGQTAWEPFCLWYDEVQQSLPFAAALSNWEAMKRIATYPPENKLPEAAKALGETAWGWALVTFLRGQPRQRVEEFLAKAESDTAKRPKLLAPVLRALLENNAVQFNRVFVEYLTYYRKSEFKHRLSKLVTFEGTILYHLGRKQGFEIILPDNISDHVIRMK